MPVPADPAPPLPELAPRWVRPVLLAVLAALWLASMAFSTALNLNNPWTSVRLAPAFALAHGDPLYSLPDRPPWVMVGYGPLYPWMYLPSVVAHGPALAVAIGTVLAHLYLLVPVALLLALFCARLGVERGQALEMGVLPGLLVFGGLMFVAGSVDYVTRRVHVDAPTFGLLLLACFAALRAEPPAPTRAGMVWTLAAGALGALSVCCKVNALGSVGAVGLYVWWSAGGRRMAGFALAAVGVAGCVYGWAAWRNGWPPIAHNFRTLARFPWYKWQALELSNGTLAECSRDWREKFLSAGYLGVQSVQTYAVTFLAVALTGYRLNRRAKAVLPVPEPPADVALPEVLATVPVPLPFASAHGMILCLSFVALMGVPAAVASVAKYGGAVNGWAFVSVPLSVAGILVVTALLEHASRAERATAHAVLAAGALTATLACVAGFFQAHPWRGTLMGEAFETVRAHPGQCYFASDPLAHLLAGERFRPNLDTVYSYAVAGTPVDPAAFKADMPGRLEYVVIARKIEVWGADEIHRLLPEENVETDKLHLRFHDVWMRPEL